MLSSSKISVDDDLFWHLASGRYIVTNLSIPSTNVFGHAYPEIKWIPFEWGWEVLMYITYNFTGYNGISIFRTFLVLCIYSLLFSMIIKLKLNFNLSILLLFFSSFSLLPRFTARPHLITYVFLLAVISIIIHVRYLKKDRKYLYILPLIFLVWGNMHVNGVIGLIVFGIYIFSETAERKWQKKEPSKPRLKDNEFAFCVMIFILSAASLLINPYNIGTYIFEYKLMGLKLLENINEWRSPLDTSAMSVYLIIYFFFVALGMVSIIYGYRKKDLFVISMFCFSVIYSLKAVRFTFDFFILSLIIIIISLSYLISLFKSQQIKELFDKNKAVSLALSVFLLIISYFLFNNSVYKSILNTPFRETGFGINEKYYPSDLIRFIKENKVDPTGSNVFNSLNCGGFLIWNCDGMKNFIDTRNLNDDLYNEYKLIDSKAAGFENKLNEHSIDLIIYSLPYCTQNARVIDRSLISFLIKNNNEWKLIYWDDRSFMFVKKEEKFKDLISKYEFKYLNPYNLIFNFTNISNAAKTDRTRLTMELDRKIKEEPDGVFINDLVRRIKFL